MHVLTFAGPVQWVGGVAFGLLLLTVCISDLRTRRIPNGLVSSILVLGLSSSLISPSPLNGVESALIAGAVGLIIWLPFFGLHMIGGGDVKFFAAASTWLGCMGSIQAAVWSALFGAVLTVIWSVVSRRRTDMNPRLPYGIAMAAGLASAAWLPRIL